MKKPLEISMRSNGFRYLKQSLVLAVQEIRLLPLDCLVVHGFKSIRPLKTIQDAIFSHRAISFRLMGFLRFRAACYKL